MKKLLEEAKGLHPFSVKVVQPLVDPVDVDSDSPFAVVEFTVSAANADSAGDAVRRLFKLEPSEVFMVPVRSGS